ncbi:cornichon [Gorgonomyces haynaldii]|nr:cornichon [Gorgonomyces haynaldii]
MNGEAILFLFSLIADALLLFAMVFYIILFSDLECDYINPIDLCNRLNQFVLPENGLHFFLWFLFLVNGSWTALLINTPLVAWHAYKISQKKHMYDATEIFRTLPDQKKEAFVKLGFYLLSFFYFLYRMIDALVAGSPINK